MPLITHALLYAGYALISLTVGLALNQVGGEGAASAFLGGIALFSACAVTHAGIAAAAAAGKIGGTEKRIKADVERLRAAHREVMPDMDAVTARLEAVENMQMAAPPSRMIEAPPPAYTAAQWRASPEMKMIEQIVDRLGVAMETRFAHLHAERRAGRPCDARADGSGARSDAGKPRRTAFCSRSCICRSARRRSTKASRASKTPTAA